MAVAFKFPKMEVEDIIGALNGWNLSVNEVQILRPTPDFVRDVYRNCLEHITAINEDSVQGAVQDAFMDTNIDETDLYASALSENILLYHLTRLAQAACIDNFNSRDLTHPEPARTRVLLSAFINFIKFTEQYCHEPSTKIMHNAEKVVQERRAAEDELSRINQEITVIKAKLAEDEPRCEQLRMENKKLHTEMLGIKEIQYVHGQDAQRLKEEKEVLLGRMQALTAEIDSKRGEVVRTRSRIVQSPDRIKRAISVMSTSVTEDKRAIAQTEAKARDLKAKADALIRIEKDLGRCVAALRVIEREAAALQVMIKESTDIKEHLKQKEIEHEEFVLRHERLEKQVANAQDKLERAQRHAEDKRTTNARTLERLDEEYKQMSEERRDNDRVVKDLTAETEEVERKMSEHLRVNEAEIKELVGEYFQLRHATEVYRQMLADKLGMMDVS
ncbi:Nuf2 family-domain-containing protein [Schizophyllum amplum]|uniref:Nuf2 family-domain-containing protein n=1 Tax=Schizophyllum amplum TaxID=97359 RepID=A0A550C3S8_9AGAR|nr:Nuf2 family-domain-containing protein [Auriculariopsis ampla]